MLRKLTLCLPPVFAGGLVAQEPVQPPQPNTYIDFEDLTKSGLPIRFYGFLRLDAYHNTARANSVITPFVVLPESNSPSPVAFAPTAKPNDGQSFLDPRLTRFGLDVLPGEVNGVTIAGKLEIDFANFPVGSSESRATPRIRLAYIDIDYDAWGLRVGQDWDTISPLHPAVNHETLMWNAGNLGDRRAQIQGRYERESFSMKVALGLTGAINNQDLDVGALAGTGVSTERDGFDSGTPHVQVRAGFKSRLLVDDKPATIGLWGAYGQTEVDVAINGQSRFDIVVGGVDLQLPLTDALTVRGEGFFGDNHGDFRGGIGLTVNRTTGQEISSVGGWGELVWQAGERTKFHVGCTTDNPQDSDLVVGNPNENVVGYIGTVHDWESGLRTGFDVLYWETDWLGVGQGNMLRFDLYLQLNF